MKLKGESRKPKGESLKQKRKSTHRLTDRLTDLRSSDLTHRNISVVILIITKKYLLLFIDFKL